LRLSNEFGTRPVQLKSVHIAISEGGSTIDLDKVLGNPADQTRMLPIVDTGNHLRPNETGHRMIAEVVDLDLFKIKFTDKFF